MNNGWISLHRKLLDNPIVCKDSDYIAVWVYLLLKATHKEQDKIFKGKRIKLKAGQVITGRKVIAKKFKISESKVQRILKTFKSEQQIEQQTSNINRLITITNWKEHQKSEQQIEQQVNNKRTTSEQRVNTNNNDNKENKDNKKEYMKSKNFPNVKITSKQFEELIKDYGRDKILNQIEKLSNYMYSTGKTYKSHAHALRSWFNKDGIKKINAKREVWTP